MCVCSSDHPHCHFFLFSLAGDVSSTYFLTFARLAPVQVATWGFPASLSTVGIDYFISFDGMEPADAAHVHYEEQLVRMEKPPWHFYRAMHSGRTCVQLLEGTLSRSAKLKIRAEFGLPIKGRIYMIPQAGIKLHPSMDKWMTMLLRSDRHRSACKCNLQRSSRDSLPPTRQSDFPQAELGHRVIFVPRTKGRLEFLNLLHTADVILDTWPWSGFTTSLQAMASEKCIVTLRARDARGRFTSSVLELLDLSAPLIAHSPSEWVQKALRCGTDPSLRRNVEARLRLAAEEASTTF